MPSWGIEEAMVNRGVAWRSCSMSRDSQCLIFSMVDDHHDLHGCLRIPCRLDGAWCYGHIPNSLKLIGHRPTMAQLWSKAVSCLGVLT